MKHSPKSVRLRFATEGEAADIASVLHRAFVEYQSLYTPEAFTAATPTTAEILLRWSEGPVWAALQQDRLVGTVAAVPEGDALYIRSMAIVPKARGLGIGTLLLRHVESYAEMQDFNRLSLTSRPFLLSAIRLYERFGFRKTGEGPFDLLGSPLFAMEKVLS